MRRGEPLEIYLGDSVRLRKQHPCGSFDWTVVRLGADIGLRCHGCNRRVLLPRSELEKRLKAFLSRSPQHELAHLDPDGPAVTIASGDHVPTES